MDDVYLRNINPLGHVDLALIGREGPVDGVEGVGCLLPGEVFKVSAAQAGVAPHWREATEDDAEAIARGHVATRTVERELAEPSGDDDADAEELPPVVEVLDPGYGLLAQVGNYELVDAEGNPADGLDDLKVAELKEHAAAQDPPIDLGSAKTKAEILAAIRKG